MGRAVIVVYKPKLGKDRELMAAVRKHLQVLGQENLVTDTPAHVMRAADGSVLEVFEWRSSEAISQAHSNAAVQALWREFGDACEYVPLATLSEASQLFAEFESLSL
jgi:hypothetical protein